MATRLVQRSLDSQIAYIFQSVKALEGYQGALTVKQFLSHVYALAEQLPENKHALNLCSNRYLFLVSICAAVLRKQITLLPPNSNAETQRKLAERYAGSYVLHDADFNIATELESFSLSSISLCNKPLASNDIEANIPSIPLEQLAVISFTSGSTGDSQPNLKTWHTLTTSTEINRKHMLPKLDSLYTVLATVPGQHMWGFETSVLMALFSNACLVDSQPLYPKDIQSTLEKLPEPRVLVSAPIHLKSLAMSGLEFPTVEVVLCATSPLNAELATKVEETFSATVHEVYGCSEVGSMALRKTASQETWTTFTGIDFKRSPQQPNQAIASAQHLPEEITLNDRFEFIGKKQFKFMGRATDMVDIGGKRGSLAELNQVMLGFEGIIDGAILFPEQNKAVPRLVAILVLKDGYTTAQFKTYFSQHVDSAFVPRPIFTVEKMPREQSGKMPLKKVISLYQSLLESRAAARQK